MENNVKKLIDDLLNAQSKQDLEIAIDQLAMLGEPAIKPLIDLRQSIWEPNQRGNRSRILRVFKKMGYPLNKAILQEAVFLIDDINSMEWDNAISIIRDSGLDAIPFIRERLNYYIDKQLTDDDEIEGIIDLLWLSDPNIISSLEPGLISLSSKNHIDVGLIERIREILQKIYQSKKH